MEILLLGKIGMIFILLGLNAFFAGAEMAIISLDKNRLKMLVLKGNKNAEMLEKLLAEPTKFLSVIQVGVTLAGFFSSATAATAISVYFHEHFIKFFGRYGIEISVIVITVVLSFVTLVFGELVPKRIALQNPEGIALWAARPITFFAKISKPFIKFLSISTHFVTRILGIEMKNLEQRISEEEIIGTLRVGQEHGVINETEFSMLTNIFHFDDRNVSQIMTPRERIVALDVDATLDFLLEMIRDKKFSRYPVYRGFIDNVIGVLYIKTLLNSLIENEKEEVVIENILLKPIFVHEKKKTDILFLEIRASKQHMAIVKDEYGLVVGVVTLEDLVEEVMGEISDEYDRVEKDVILLKDGELVVTANYPLYKFEQLMDIKLEKQEYDTLLGYFTWKLDKVPTSGDSIIIPNTQIRLAVFTSKEHKVLKIKVSTLEDVKES